jgi:hypothetical protein
VAGDGIGVTMVKMTAIVHPVVYEMRCQFLGLTTTTALLAKTSEVQHRVSTDR